jgi:chromatin segregation and condensation protein Rec8/ScpA/Scc1 (kleisin family)
MEDLIDAFVRILGRVGERAVKIEKTRVVLDRFTVADKIKDIVVRLKSVGILHFSGLFEPDMTRSEVINTFLAVLELLKNQIITARQVDNTSEETGVRTDIEIKKGGSYDGKIDDVGSSEFDRNETPDSP